MQMKNRKKIKVINNFKKNQIGNKKLKRKKNFFKNII